MVIGPQEAVARLLDTADPGMLTVAPVVSRAALRPMARVVLRMATTHAMDGQEAVAALLVGNVEVVRTFAAWVASLENVPMLVAVVWSMLTH